jgi:hemolysin activation/secretion protein
MRPGFATLCAVAALASGVASTAWAQQASPRLPSAAEPGRPPLLPALPEEKGATSGAVSVARAPASQAPAGSENYTFVLTALDIQGVTAFPAAQISALSAGLVGKTVSVRDMFALAAKLELRYRSAGYVTTAVIVPAQTLDGGRFHITVVEGFVSDIVYPDDIGPAKAAIRSLIEPLRAIRPIRIAAVERQLLLANDLPGLTIRADLEPSKTELGGSVLVVHATRKALDASVSIDNRSTPYVGSTEVLPSVSFNAFGSHADQLSLSGKISSPLKREWMVQGDYQRLLSGNGLTFGFNSSYAHVNPGLELDPLDVQSQVVSEIGTLTYPIIRSRLQNLRAVGEVEYRDVTTQANDAPFNRDNLRILRLGISYDRTDSWNGITALQATVHEGLGVLGATRHGSPLASRADGNSEYTKFTGGLTRLQQLPDHFSLFATVTGQVSSAPLLASEQIALGGGSFGRAYDEGEISGDNGWAGSMELRFTPNPPKLLPNGVQLYAFFDGGEVWDISKVPPLIGGQSLSSAGAGVRASLTRRLLASVEIAQPLDREVQTLGGKPTRVFFSITARY